MTVIREGESPGDVSARVGAPICALMRANRLVCPAWLYPGREIRVPGPGFCADDAFPCPARLARVPARDRPARAFVAEAGDTVASMARALGVSERLLLLALEKNQKTTRRGGARSVPEGTRFLLDEDALDAEVLTVLPGESLRDFARRAGAEAAEIERVNRIAGGRIWPGMRLIAPKPEGG